MVGISRSLWRKLVATAAGAAAFVLMNETRVIDFRQIAMPGQAKEALPGDEPIAPNANHLRFAATAYCKGTTTASGVNVRTGIVQTAAGGTLRLFRPLFSAGLGGRLGDGLQWLSWIDADDLLDVYYRALYDDRLSGPVNAVAPNPVRNVDYTKALAGVLHRPALLPVPSFGPRILLGAQGARELAEADQRVAPAKLQAIGHRFRRPTVEQALAFQLGHG